MVFQPDDRIMHDTNAMVNVVRMSSVGLGGLVDFFPYCEHFLNGSFG